jgi:hypothetical protein
MNGRLVVCARLDVVVLRFFEVVVRLDEVVGFVVNADDVVDDDDVSGSEEGELVVRPGRKSLSSVRPDLVVATDGALVVEDRLLEVVEVRRVVAGAWDDVAPGMKSLSSVGPAPGFEGTVEMACLFFKACATSCSSIVALLNLTGIDAFAVGNDRMPVTDAFAKTKLESVKGSTEAAGSASASMLEELNPTGPNMSQRRLAASIASCSLLNPPSV